jgi:hypothetical protein
VLTNDGQYSLSIVTSYFTLTHQIYAMTCSLTGRSVSHGSGDQYHHRLYRYDLSIRCSVGNLTQAASKPPGSHIASAHTQGGSALPKLAATLLNTQPK